MAAISINSKGVSLDGDEKLIVRQGSTPCPNMSYPETRFDSSQSSTVQHGTDDGKKRSRLGHAITRPACRWLGAVKIWVLISMETKKENIRNRDNVGSTVNRNCSIVTMKGRSRLCCGKDKAQGKTIPQQSRSHLGKADWLLFK
ncbi:hypothetical protein RUM43_012488 [Polyplax serrata]|uniref:Uncharacterized protein n=1 Tax=Polyplax serrata TaxID=468196 RepID=A0AAN8P3V7_POLSC